MIAVLTLFFSLTTVIAGERNLVKVGDAFSLPPLTDQFDKHQALLPGTHWLVFSHDMKSSKVVKKAFKKQSAETLAAAGVQYYADISKMPALIGRLVAIPKLKMLNYPVVLAREPGDLAHLPRQEDKATLLKISEGDLVSFSSTNDPAIVRQQVFSGKN